MTTMSEQSFNDIESLVLAMARAAADNGNRTELNDFIAELGLTEAVADIAESREGETLH